MGQFIAPSWFTKDLPKEPLDGELWCGRGLFQKTLSIIKKTVNPEKYADDWKYVSSKHTAPRNLCTRTMGQLSACRVA